MSTPIHLVVPGTPVSCQSKRSAVQEWKSKVASVARSRMAQPLSENELSIVITYYFRVPPRADTDNISKPICDALSRIVYRDDRQIAERTARRIPLNRAFVVNGMPPELAVALCRGDEFVFIKIDKVGIARFVPPRTRLALAWC